MSGKQLRFIPPLFAKASSDKDIIITRSFFFGWVILSQLSKFCDQRTFRGWKF